MSKHSGITQIFAAERDGERHVVLWRRGRLCAYLIDGGDARDRSGGIFVGQIDRVEKSLGAVFVQFDAGETGMLPLRPNERRVEGERLIVQVTRDRVGNKAARLTAAPILEGRFVDLLSKEIGVHMVAARFEPGAARTIRAALRKMIQAGVGLRLTARAIHTPLMAIKEEAATLCATWEAIRSDQNGRAPGACLLAPPGPVRTLVNELSIDEPVRIIADTRALAARVGSELANAGTPEAPDVSYVASRDWVPATDDIADALRSGLDPRVPLDGGAWLLFEPGETLTAIDVNSGEATARHSGANQADLRAKLNTAATAEIAHQLRLRNIGGLVVVDFIDMKSAADRDRVVKGLRAALADDPARTRVLPMSDLGLVQLTRERRGRSLTELFLAPCGHCNGVGRLIYRRPIGAAAP